MSYFDQLVAAGKAKLNKYNLSQNIATSFQDASFISILKIFFDFGFVYWGFFFIPVEFCFLSFLEK